jgi:hypothetical protein
MRERSPESSEAHIEAAISQMLKYPAKQTRLDTQTDIYGFTLVWKHTAPELVTDKRVAVRGVILNTSDWERFCEVVGRVMELRKRHPDGLFRYGASLETKSAVTIVHIARSGRR